jgi:hypothetical protein
LIADLRKLLDELLLGRGRFREGLQAIDQLLDLVRLLDQVAAATPSSSTPAAARGRC